MFKKQSIIYLSLLGIGLLLASSCSSATPITKPTRAVLEPELMDKSWLTGTPCEAPCWYGLELGKSTYSEVLITIKSLSFLNPARFNENNWDYPDYESGEFYPGKMVSIDCKTPNYHVCVSMRFKEDTLEDLFIDLNYDIQLGEVVEILGEPDGFSATPTGVEDHDCLLKLYWLERRIIIFHHQNRDELPDLCQIIKDNENLIPSDLLVDTVNYFQENYIEYFINQLQDWKGFIK